MPECSCLSSIFSRDFSTFLDRKVFACLCTYDIEIVRRNESSDMSPLRGTGCIVWDQGIAVFVVTEEGYVLMLILSYQLCTSCDHIFVIQASGVRTCRGL